MGVVFLKVFEMSIAALLLILAVVLLRFPLRRAPKWFMGVLWAIVALRLRLRREPAGHRFIYAGRYILPVSFGGGGDRPEEEPGGTGPDGERVFGVSP